MPFYNMTISVYLIESGSSTCISKKIHEKHILFMAQPYKMVCRKVLYSISVCIWCRSCWTMGGPEGTKVIRVRPSFPLEMCIYTSGKRKSAYFKLLHTNTRMWRKCKIMNTYDYMKKKWTVHCIMRVAQWCVPSIFPGYTSIHQKIVTVNLKKNAL